jgi:hypothetical protein
LIFERKKYPKKSNQNTRLFNIKITVVFGKAPSSIKLTFEKKSSLRDRTKTHPKIIDINNLGLFSRISRFFANTPITCTNKADFVDPTHQL